MKNVSAKTFWLCIFAGVAIRFLFMQAGYNYDFESYCVVGDLAAAGKNVYANTHRYNYGPLWFTLLGLFWRTASYFGGKALVSLLVFRCLIVGTLTLADFFIARLVAKKAGTFWGAVFFLNPVSLIISGCHNQFDNIAVLFGALGVCFIEKSCSESEMKTEDLLGTVLFSLSMITKHILFAFPVWILMNTKINTRKKFLYAFVPAILFLLSFVPYWGEGSQRIINRVFMYKAGDNFPLFALSILKHFGYSLPFIGRPVFFMFLLAGAYVFRNKNIYESFLLYTITLVCFSSAVANQYMVIPCMALIILCGKHSIPFFFAAMVYLTLNWNGLNIMVLLEKYCGIVIPYNAFVQFFTSGNSMPVVVIWCLLYSFIYCYRRRNISNTLPAQA